MPTDSLLVAIAICAMFLIFAAALAWADRQSRLARRERELAQQRATTSSSSAKRAA